jgi:hypothetical protein
VTNEDLQLAVIDELRWDPKIDSEWDEVSAHDGTVTLRAWMCRSSAHCGGRTITCFGTCCRP